MNKRIIFATLVTGFNGMVIQLLLLREMLVVFHGNDLAIGIIFSNWLVCEALGAYFVGRRIELTKRVKEWFITLSVLFAILTPATIYLVRIVRDLISVMPGVGIGVLPIFYSSLLILFLPSLLHGALFVLTCSLSSPSGNTEGASGTHQGATSIGRVYAWETIGHIIGAVAFTLLLIPLFNSFSVAFGIGILSIIAALGLLDFKGKSLAPWGIALMGITVSLLILSSGIGTQLHHQTVARQWPGKEVVHYQNSQYGNLTVIHREGEYTFVSDGVPVITTPTPDIVRVEELVHYPMLAHTRPESVAVVGGGAGGVISEILKYPSIKRVDYMELDPLLIDLVRRFPTPLTEGELSDPRVNTMHLDGRRFLKLTDNQYDLVFAGASKPENLEVNRFFTIEFASIVKERMRDDGILVMSMPGSLTYISSELKNMNGVIINTLKRVFPFVHVIPGDHNILLASTTCFENRMIASKLNQKLEELQLETQLLTYPYINHRLSQEWQDWFWVEMGIETTSETNSDFRPKGFFYTLAYWNALFNPYLSRFFGLIEGIEISFYITVLTILVGIILALGWKFRGFRRMAIPYSVATTGFAGMAVDLILIFSFQVLFGYVYHWIGLLLAAFMAGISLGGFAMAAHLPKVKDCKGLLTKLELGVLFFTLMLPVVIMALAPNLANPSAFLMGQLIFLVLALVAGVLTGAKFPLANRLYLTQYPGFSRGAGLLYGTDLMGGWAGGILIAVVMLPALGLVGTCLVVAIIKVSSLIPLTVFSRLPNR